MSGFAGFCRGATDGQLEAILFKEWEGSQRDPDRAQDYAAASREAARRGWTVHAGKRL